MAYWQSDATLSYHRAYFNCITPGINVPAVPGFVPPALVFCPNFVNVLHNKEAFAIRCIFKQENA